MPEELARTITEERPPMVIDFRNPEQFRDSHLPGAINIPQGELEDRASDLDLTVATVFY